MATNKEILAQLAQLTALVTKQAETIATLQAGKPAKAKKAEEKKPAKPEGFAVEPSTFNFSGCFGAYVPDGYNGISSAAEPTGLIVVNRRDRSAEKGPDGLFPVTETRYYIPTRGWKRSKKNEGWVTTFPKKATDEQIAEMLDSAIEDAADEAMLKAL